MLLVLELKISANCSSQIFIRLHRFTGSLCYFDGEEGKNIKDWKYEHYYVCAIALKWF